MDEAVVKAVEELKRSPMKRLRSEEWVRGTRAGALQRKGLCAKRHTTKTRDRPTTP